jgi:hypothetical protein
MKTIDVIAVAEGYYVNRIVPVFTMFKAREDLVTKPGAKLDANGDPVYKTLRTQFGVDRVLQRDPKAPRELATWLVLDTPENRKMVDELRKNGVQNAKAAALAAAGPKRSRRGFAVAEGAEESVDLA